jgi:Na+/H+-dicarboxylate symporter
MNAAAIQGYTQRAAHDSVAAHLMAIIPDTFVSAFANGDLLQVLLLAVLTGFAINALPDRLREPISHAIDAAAAVFFGIVSIVVKAAPVGAFGAMAFTIGAYGFGSLLLLGELVATFYLTALFFVIVVLGAISRFCGFSIFRFVAYTREELLIVLGTSSSESVLAQIMRKMEALAATLSVIPDIPIAALAILIGIDKFMSEVRALTNLVGNGVACLAISRSEGELDPVKLHHAMGGKPIAGARPQPGPVVPLPEPVASRAD